MIAYFLLRGIHWLWLFEVGTTILALLTDPLIGTITWHYIASGIIELALLLAPETRRYFALDAVSADT